MGCHMTVSKPPPRNLKVQVQNPWHLWLRGEHRHQRPPLAIPQALEVVILADMTPLLVIVEATKRVL